MASLAQVLVLSAFLVAGLLASRWKRAPSAKAVDMAIKVALRALLAIMGLRIGNDPALMGRLMEIGLMGLTSAFLSCAGTIAAVFIGYGLLALVRRTRRGRADAALVEKVTVAMAHEASAGKTRSIWARFRDPLGLVAFVVAGAVVGFLIPPLGGIVGEASSWALNALLFLIGMQFGQSRVDLRAAFLRPETIMVPTATALGSLVAALVMVPLFGLSPGRSMALASGFGWYSLSGVILSDLGSPLLGSASFIANMARETIALVSIPFLARGAYPGLAIGLAGATAMDVSLPLIEQSAGPGIVPASFASGAILSLSVPFATPLFFGLG